MSEPIKKKFKQTPESYSPKVKPIILSMAEQAGIEIQKIAPQYLINTTFPTGNNPWVGGCDYLRCFTSLYMHIEGMRPTHDMRFGLYRKFLVVSGMGMVTTFSDKLEENNYSFEAAHDYIGRLHRFTGYRYDVIDAAGRDKSELFKIISDSIYRGRPVMMAYADNNHFNRKWRLFIGYDYDDMMLSVNEDGTVTPMSDWLDKLDNIILIKQSGLPKPDMKEMLIEIISDAERSESQGTKCGYAAYEALITKLRDDAFFTNADVETLTQFNDGGVFNGGALGSFFWYHAEGRGAVGEGFGQLCGAELKDTAYETDISANGFYGYNGHQTAYIGCMAIRKGAVALRDSTHREVLVYCLHQLMSNDTKILKMIKLAIGIDTPDVLIPKDTNGNPVDYCFRSKDMMNWKTKGLIEEYYAIHMKSLNAGTVISQCMPVKMHMVDFNNDVTAVGVVEHNLLGNTISIKTEDNIYETKGLIKTKQTFSAPIKIDACIENKDTAFLLSFNACIENQPTWLSFNGGYMKNSSWGRQPGKIITWDISVGYCMDFNPEFPAVHTDNINISWILQRDFMAVIVNDVLVNYIENLPYTHFELPAAPVGFSAFDNKTVKVKSLVISEL